MDTVLDVDVDVTVSEAGFEDPQAPAPTTANTSAATTALTEANRLIDAQ